MIFRLLADFVLLVHLVFILLVAAGALLLLRWPRLAWLQVPSAVWGIAISVGGWVCPLTPLENRLRERGGEAGYSGSFIDHYLLPVIYPEGLTPVGGLVLAGIVAAVNGFVWAVLVRRWWRGRRRQAR